MYYKNIVPGRLYSWHVHGKVYTWNIPAAIYQEKNIWGYPGRYSTVTVTVTVTGIQVYRCITVLVYHHHDDIIVPAWQCRYQNT